MNIWETDLKTLRAEYKKIARKANTKLKNLEKTGYADKSKAYQHIKKDAKMGIKGVTDSVRFQTDTRKMNINKLRSVATEAEKFLSANSITKTQIDKAYRQSYRTFKDKFSSAKNLSYREYINLVESFEENNLNQIYGSDRIVTFYASLKKSDREKFLSELDERLQDEGEVDLYSLKEKYGLE